MASAEIITIGTELLLGHLVDTNTPLIASALADAGIDVYRHTSVGDNEERIAAAVREALDRADVAICCGGLGPTVDDMTRAAVARATGRPLERREEIVAELKAFFASVGRTMSPNNELQALVPAGAVVMDNPKGTAPGFIVELNGRAVLAMPGPPRELRPMLEKRALPWLRERFGAPGVIVTRVLRTIGVAESEIDAKIADLFRAGTNPSIAVLAHAGQVDVKVTAKAQTRAAAEVLIAELEPVLRARLGDCVFAEGDASIERVAGEMLRTRGWTIAVAESCTGGLLGEMITDVPGSSAYFRGGVIAYADDVKKKLLGIDDELLARVGAVSEEVAAAMARGIRDRTGADIGVAITGVAGPDGGSPDKPVGLVYVALAGPDAALDIRRLMLPGDRELVRRRAALAALTLVWKAARP